MFANLEIESMLIYHRTWGVEKTNKMNLFKNKIEKLTSMIAEKNLQC